MHFLEAEEPTDMIGITGRQTAIIGQEAQQAGVLCSIDCGQTVSPERFYGIKG